MMKKFILSTAVFICGVCLVMLQMAAGRVFAPFWGTSAQVSNILSGVFLGSLALGCFLGGKIADKKSNLLMISLIIFCTSFYTGLIAFIDVPVLNFLQLKISDLQIKSFISALLLFTPPSLLLGTIFPFIFKLQNTETSRTSSDIGKLLLLILTGNILGSFLTTFVLLPFIGTQKLLLLIRIILLITSFVFLSIKKFSKKVSSVFFILFLVLAFCFHFNVCSSLGGKITDIDTQYSRVWIYDTEGQNGKKMRKMQINNESSSAMFLDSNDLVDYYTKAYDLMKHFNKNFRKALMIGGAGYSYPKYFLSKYPDAEIDVVEIDPKVTDLAKKHFNLSSDPRLSIYHEDGRTFLNTAAIKYDAILGDGFMSSATPFHLATKEAALKMYESLNDDGVVITNIISAVEGSESKVLRSAYITFKTVFPQVYVLGGGTGIQNVILVALKSKEVPSFKSENPLIDSYLQKKYPHEISDSIVLTDDYAPVEYYSMQNSLPIKLISKFF